MPKCDRKNAPSHGECGPPCNGCLGPPAPYPKRDLDPFTCFWRAHGCIQHTQVDTHTETYTDLATILCRILILLHGCMEHQVEGPRPGGGPRGTWREVVREDCQARKFNKEDAMDRCKWRKMIKEARWSGWVWVGECSFWYRPTRVVPDQRPLNGRCCCCCLILLHAMWLNNTGYAAEIR